MIELVMNHTSDQHPWFQRARVSATRVAGTRLITSGATPNRSTEMRAIIFTDTEKIELDLGSSCQAVFLASLLFAPA